MPGLLIRAAAELDLDLGASWMIGDSVSDVGAGAAAGTRTAYIGSEVVSEATITAPSLDVAAAQVCAAG